MRHPFDRCIAATYLPFGLLGVLWRLACARSEAATSFSRFVELGLRRILEASDAGFFPVVIFYPSKLIKGIGGTDAYRDIATIFQLSMLECKKPALGGLSIED